MKKLFIVTLLALSIGLSGCKYSCTDDVNEYKTPELFLAHFETAPRACYFESSKPELNSKRVYDEEGLMNNELKKITEYKTLSKINEKSETYFIYENWIAATSGPNIARMTIYENGYLEIYRKQSLGKKHYFYFSIDLDLAVSLNRFAEEQISISNL